MKQVSFINTHESQTEYVKAMQAGYGYTRHGNVAHYLFKRDQVEPSILTRLPVAEHYIFSYRGCTMASYANGDHAEITPYPPDESVLEWTRYADTIAADLGWT